MTFKGRAEVLWLVRHGQREDFADPDWGLTAARPHDPGLSDEGVEQARAVGVRLENEGIVRIFTSPYLRCAETAHLIAERVVAPVHVEIGLGELHHPDWTKGLPALLSRRDLQTLTGTFDLAHESVHEPTYPETIDQAFTRAGATARVLVDRYPGPILLVGHAVSIIGIVRAFTGELGEVDCPVATPLRMVRVGSGWTRTA